MSDSYRVVKTNRFGRDQERVLSLDFNSGSIVNKNTKGKTMKDHHASSVLFVECRDPNFQLVIHFPNKEYKLEFGSDQERTDFQEKLVDLCQTTKRMNEPITEEMFNPDAEDLEGARLNYTFAFKYSKNANPKLREVVVLVDQTGMALCDPKPQQNPAGTSGTTFKVQSHFMFQQLKSWTNEGKYVEMELVTNEKVDELYKFKGMAEADANALVEAIQVCIAAAMKEMKAKKAAKKAAAKAEAAAAGGATSARPATTGAGSTRAERIRRASMVVDLSAMADGITEAGDGRSRSLKSKTLEQQLTTPNTAMSSQANLMAAACRAIEEDSEFMEDDEDDEGIGVDIVDVMMDAMSTEAPAPLGVKEGRGGILETRRRSVMMDISTGTADTMEQGTDRSKRANLLKDLAGIIEDADTAARAAPAASDAEPRPGPKIAKKASRSKAATAARRRSVMVSVAAPVAAVASGDGYLESVEEEI